MTDRKSEIRAQIAALHQELYGLLDRTTVAEVAAMDSEESDCFSDQQPFVVHPDGGEFPLAFVVARENQPYEVWTWDYHGNETLCFTAPGDYPVHFGE